MHTKCWYEWLIWIRKPTSKINVTTVKIIEGEPGNKNKLNVKGRIPEGT